MNEPQLMAALLILTRVSVFVGFFTLFSFQQLPRLVKISMAVGLSVFWFGELETTAGSLADARFGMLQSTLLLGKEFLIGAMLAIALNLMLMPCKIAGAYIGQELGLSLASISNPGTPDSATLITRVFETFTVLAFFALDLHHFLIMTMDYSFRELTGRFDVFAMPTEQLVSMLNDTSDYGLMIIAPLVVLLMIVTLGLALLNRAAPTLNLFSIGMGLRTGFGIFCMLMFLPVLFGGIRGYLLRLESEIEGLLVGFF